MDARTLSQEANWQYINVRRLVSFLSDSIRQSSTWAVFEPNDERLRATLRHRVSEFLTDEWKQGALAGRTPDEAFYVICDESNNPPESLTRNLLTIDIGAAAVRPAEFINIRINQTLSQPEEG
ncbi:phage tail sheath C-terminal domain-containing protein [Streptomyces sp. T-3]|nr:phage tail sheath C-terminal domain-containing protein [Streptomyces sp. T-3]